MPKSKTASKAASSSRIPKASYLKWLKTNYSVEERLMIIESILYDNGPALSWAKQRMELELDLY